MGKEESQSRRSKVGSELEVLRLSTFDIETDGAACDFVTLFLRSEIAPYHGHLKDFESVRARISLGLHPASRSAAMESESQRFARRLPCSSSMSSWWR